MTFHYKKDKDNIDSSHARFNSQQQCAPAFED